MEGAETAIIVRAPRAPLEIAIMPIGIHLQLAAPNTIDAAWLADSLTAILTELFAVAVLSADAPSPFSLSVTVRGPRRKRIE